MAENLLRRFTQLTAAGATAKLALSIRDMEDDDEQGIKVVPPLLREKVKTAVRYHGDYILGYVLNAGFCQDVLRWHKIIIERKTSIWVATSVGLVVISRRLTHFAILFHSLH